MIADKPAAVPRPIVPVRPLIIPHTSAVVAAQPAWRRYVFASLMYVAAAGLMSIGHAAVLREGFSWSLVSLLAIVATANLWGVRAAILVMVLSLVYAGAIWPHLPATDPGDHPSLLAFMIARSTAFTACAATSIYLTYRVRLMRDRAERRREVVSVLQSMILPSVLVGAPGYDLAARYRPARRDEQVGGDFYDFFVTGDGRYGILIGDVMGKGKEAAASTAMIRYSVRAFTSAGSEPAHVLRQVGEMMESQALTFDTASVFLGYLCAETGELVYANAGHEPPLLRRADGGQELLESTGPLLGMEVEPAFEERATRLAAGDALFLMTDGVTEARNNDGQFLGERGTWMMLDAALRAETVKEALESIDSALTGYIGDNARDDIAMMLLRRNG